MCIDLVTTSLFEPRYTIPDGVVRNSRSAESKISKAVRNFFLVCTAVSGIAFAVTGAAGALTTCLILGTITFCLYFPSNSSSSYSYNSTRRVATSFFDPPPVTVVRRNEYVQPPTVFVERPRHHHRNRGHFELPVDAFIPTAAQPVDLYERHQVGNQRRQEHRQQVQQEAAPVDLFARHPVGGRVVQEEFVQQDGIDPFERHPVGNG